MTDEYRVPHTVVCYYFSHIPELRNVFNCALQFLEKNGLQPNWMATSLDRKVIQYKRSFNKLVSSEFVNVNSFEMYRIPEGFGNDWSNGFSALVSCDTENHCFMTSLREPLLDHTTLDRAFYEFARTCNPDYGFRDQRPNAGALSAMIPGFQWDKYYLAGFIHKVSGWNVLNPYHLKRRIAGLSFAEWVAQDARRGILAPYFQDSWLWRVSQEHISDTIQPLADAEIIYDGHKHSTLWEWAFFPRLQRGDLTKQDLFRLLIKEIQDTGQVPIPPRCEQSGPSGQWRIDHAGVTQCLRRWGHPAAKLPEPPTPMPLSSEEVLGNVLQGLGYTSPGEARILQPTKEGGLRELPDDKAAKILPKEKRRK